ncbi:hypothetical protein [Variovorax saccharolyticus]|uniref:hypothetical protein n=1 Tax=Variovorax saccharolyticus TaxID=3053516 RepID=UPI0025782795|nr:hypothetical protein [Variovorax sp. J22R187]MDM0019452.1 hypothetical protein [Variovorax sp. J22R187]
MISRKPLRARPQDQPQFVQLPRVPALRPRELAVLEAFGRLPAESRTPSAAVLALMRQGIDVPHSTLTQILQRLERKGLIHLDRKR